jgi:hypothetical protein
MLATELTGKALEAYNTNKPLVEQLLRDCPPLNWDGFERGEVTSPFLLTEAQHERYEDIREELLRLLTEMPDTSFKRRWLRELSESDEA